MRAYNTLKMINSMSNTVNQDNHLPAWQASTASTETVETVEKVHLEFQIPYKLSYSILYTHFLYLKTT